MGPDRYLAGLFGGTLLCIDVSTGEQRVLHQFESPITALGPATGPDTAFVGLASGVLFAIREELPCIQ